MNVENNEANQIIDRLLEVHNLSSDSTLALSLNINKQSISNWRNRNSIPFELCMSIAKEKDIDLNWLLKGEGGMYRHQPIAPTSRKLQMMNKLMESLSERQQEEILSAIEEKERLNRIEKQLSDVTARLSA